MSVTESIDKLNFLVSRKTSLLVLQKKYSKTTYMVLSVALVRQGKDVNRESVVSTSYQLMIREARHLVISRGWQHCADSCAASVTSAGDCVNIAVH